MITVQNYNSKITGIDLDNLPAPLRNTHDKLMAKGGANFYGKNDAITETIDAYINKLNEFVGSQTKSKLKKDTTNENEYPVKGEGDYSPEFLFHPANENGKKLMDVLKKKGFTFQKDNSINTTFLTYKGNKFYLFDNTGEFKMDDKTNPAYIGVIYFTTSNEYPRTFESLANEIRQIAQDRIDETKASEPPKPDKLTLDSKKGDFVEYISATGHKETGYIGVVHDEKKLNRREFQMNDEEGTNRGWVNIPLPEPKTTKPNEPTKKSTPAKKRATKQKNKSNPKRKNVAKRKNKVGRKVAGKRSTVKAKPAAKKPPVVRNIKSPDLAVLTRFRNLPKSSRTVDSLERFAKQIENALNADKYTFHKSLVKEAHTRLLKVIKAAGDVNKVKLGEVDPKFLAKLNKVIDGAQERMRVSFLAGTEGKKH